MNKLKEEGIKTKLDRVIPIIFWDNGDVVIEIDDLLYLKENKELLLALLEDN